MTVFSLLNRQPAAPELSPQNTSQPQQAASPAQTSGSVFSLLNKVSEKPIEKRSPRPIKAAAREYTKGILGSYGDIAETIKLQGKTNLTPGQKALLTAEQTVPEHVLPYLQDEDIIPRYSRLPTSSDIDKYLQKAGIEKQEDFPEEKLFGRFGRLAGGAQSFGAANPVAGILGAVGGQYAENQGYGPLGQGVFEAGASFIPGSINAAKKYLATPAEKMASGLPKLRITENPNARFAKVSPQRQEKVIKGLNEEASKLATEKLYKHVPTAEKINQGFDFVSDFEDKFSKIQSIAKKANPYIDVAPVRKFMETTRDKYKGIPRVHPEGKMSLREVRAFSKNPPTKLEDLLKTYRSNNQKIKSNFEKSRLHGSQKEYTDFLLDYNKAISNSITEALPKNSKFVKMFLETNKEFKNYKDALSAKNLIDPIIGKQPTVANLKRLSDPKVQKKLALSIGKEGASDIKQISEDLLKAQASVKGMDLKTITELDKILPIATIIDPSNLTSISYLSKKALSKFQEGYGMFLTSPQKREAFHDAVIAFAKKSKPGLSAAVKKITKSFEEEDLEDLISEQD